MVIIVLKGKAKQVFEILSALAEKYGHKTLGKLKREKKIYKPPAIGEKYIIFTDPSDEAS